MPTPIEIGEPIENTSDSGGSFSLLERLGRGGFADVYRAVRITRDGLKNIVAVKLLRDDLHPHVRAEERLRHEAEIQFSLNHPVICKALQLVVLNGRPGLVTEYIDGRDLRGCFRDGMPPGPLLEVIQRVALALGYAAREHGVVHRDVTPANIRIGRHDGSVKLLDFGIAWSSLTEDRYTIQGHVTGSMHALAPERLLDTEAPPSPASDVFSLGCILYRGLEDEEFLEIERDELYRVFADESAMEAFTGERLRQMKSDTPEGIKDLLRSMLTWNPDRRPTAEQIAELCSALLEALDLQPSLINWNRDRPPEQGLPPVRFSTSTRIRGVGRRRNLAMGAALGAAVTATAAGLLAFFWPHESFVVPERSGIEGPTGGARLWCPERAPQRDPVAPECIYLLEERIGDNTVWVQDSELTGVQWRALGCPSNAVRQDPSLPVEVGYDAAVACIESAGLAAPGASVFLSVDQWRALAMPSDAPPWGTNAAKAGKWGVISVDETTRLPLSPPRHERGSEYGWRRAQLGLFDLWGNVAEWSADRMLLGGSRHDLAEDVVAVGPKPDGTLGGVRIAIPDAAIQDVAEALTRVHVLPVQWAGQASVLEFSSLVHWQDAFFAFPQYDIDDIEPSDVEALEQLRSCGGWAVHRFDEHDVEKAVAEVRKGRVPEPLEASLVTVRWDQASGHDGTCVPPFELTDGWRSEGIEAAHIMPRRADGTAEVWVLGESRLRDGSVMTACQYTGTYTPSEWGGDELSIELAHTRCRDVEWTRPSPDEPGVHNSASESLVAFRDRIWEIPEMLAGGLPGPRVLVRSLKPPYTTQLVDAPPIPWRVTDASQPDAGGRFWVINYAWIGDQSDGVYGWPCTSARPFVRGQERLVELQIRPDDSLAETGRFIALPPRGQGRNWEGIDRLTVDGQTGLLLVTDEFPENLLAWVSEEDAEEGFVACP